MRSSPAARRRAAGCRAESLRAIYREIMSASLALEKDLAIAYFGPEATWTHQAARGKFGASVRYLSRSRSISDVFDAVARGRADYGVVPIENSTEGAVNHTLDEFIESDLRICAQVALRIEHHLMARRCPAPRLSGACSATRRSSDNAVEWLRINLPNDRPDRGGQHERARARWPPSPRTTRVPWPGGMVAERSRADDPRSKRAGFRRTTRLAFWSSARVIARRQGATARR